MNEGSEKELTHCNCQQLLNPVKKPAKVPIDEVRYCLQRAETDLLDVAVWKISTDPKLRHLYLVCWSYLYIIYTYNIIPYIRYNIYIYISYICIWIICPNSPTLYLLFESFLACLTWYQWNALQGSHWGAKGQGPLELGWTNFKLGASFFEKTLRASLDLGDLVTYDCSRHRYPMFRQTHIHIWVCLNMG